MRLSRFGLAGLCLPLFVIPIAAAEEIANAAEPPVIPIGLDAFRMWDRWAYLRIGQRTYMRSTYDRVGANEWADASHFLYQLADDRNVSLDIMGAGVLAFVRTNHWHGSPWHYIVDGQDHVVQETSTANPDKPTPNSVFMPEKSFPNPLTWTWSQTKGADLMWVPIPFEYSFSMAYERTHYGTGYYIFHQFVPGTKLSEPITSWTPNNIPSAAVLELIKKSGTDIAAGRRKGSPKQVSENGTLQLKADETNTFLTLTKAPSSIRVIQFDIAKDQAAALGDSYLRIYWDQRAAASVDAPIKLLFGTGSLYNRDAKEYLVKSLPVSIRFTADRVHFAMYFPMPFLKEARFEIAAPADRELKEVQWRVRHEPYTDPANWAAHLHATYKDHGTPELGKDLVFLDTREVEGGGDWCGHFVGTSFIFSDRAGLGTLEADPRFYFDDSQTPQAQGTGTEEWGGGGDYWGGETMTLPLAGHPVGAKSAKLAKAPEDLINSEYRFLLSDLMPFGKNSRITFEHGPENDSNEHYQSVTFWYGMNQPCLKVTDTLDVGDVADETAHHYESPTASDVQTLSSRYEWGVDHIRGKEIFPESTEKGRNMKGASTFTLAIDPKNLGVMLRRTMDYAFPNQCGKVFVADDQATATWHEAGMWYTAGSNTCVYSNPEKELGATEHQIRVSNRRWRDDEFLLPLDLTKGRSKIRVKIEFIPKNIPLFPGHPLPEQAWSEYRYVAYCYVMPKL